MILDEIVEKKRLRLEREMEPSTTDGWIQRLKRPGLHTPLDFTRALRKEGTVSIIAEIKKASPSRGVIRQEFDPGKIAREYAAAGVQAVSVLTEQDYFLGEDLNLVKARQVLPVPILRKDFVVDIRQVYQSRYLGADAVLLITSILSDEELRKFRAVASILGMQCLVEVHGEEELDRALACGADLIGINNRDLRTFEVDLRTTERLLNRIPSTKTVVSESGIRTAEDMRYLKELGVNAVLVGEAFMRAADIGGLVEAWSKSEGR